MMGLGLGRLGRGAMQRESSLFGVFGLELLSSDTLTILRVG